MIDEWDERGAYQSDAQSFLSYMSYSRSDHAITDLFGNVYVSPQLSYNYPDNTMLQLDSAGKLIKTKTDFTNGYTRQIVTPANFTTLKSVTQLSNQVKGYWATSYATNNTLYLFQGERLVKTVTGPTNSTQFGKKMLFG